MILALLVSAILDLSLGECPKYLPVTCSGLNQIVCPAARDLTTGCPVSGGNCVAATVPLPLRKGEVCRNFCPINDCEDYIDDQSVVS